MNIGKVCLMHPNMTSVNTAVEARNCLKGVSDEIDERSIELRDDHFSQLVGVMEVVDTCDAVCFCGDWDTNPIIAEIYRIVTYPYFKKTIIEIINGPDGNKMMVIAK